MGVYTRNATILESCHPKNPWDVMGCQTCFEAPGVSLGGSGVSIGGVRILRAMEKGSFFAKEIII